MKCLIINVLGLISVAIVALSCSSQPKTVELFNGNDLSNWDFALTDLSVPAQDVFSVKNGVIAISGQPVGYMFTKEKYSDYKLEVEWRWPAEPTNSGIFLLIESFGTPFPRCIENQLCPGQVADFLMLGDSQLLEYDGPDTPGIHKVLHREASSELAPGEWNKAEITVLDGKITSVINGVFQNEATNPVKCGNIALQSEGGPIEFRNVRLTHLK